MNISELRNILKASVSPHDLFSKTNVDSIEVTKVSVFKLPIGTHGPTRTEKTFIRFNLKEETP